MSAPDLISSIVPHLTTNIQYSKNDSNFEIKICDVIYSSKMVFEYIHTINEVTAPLIGGVNVFVTVVD